MKTCAFAFEIEYSLQTPYNNKTHIMHTVRTAMKSIFWKYKNDSCAKYSLGAMW